MAKKELVSLVDQYNRGWLVGVEGLCRDMEFLTALRWMSASLAAFSCKTTFCGKKGSLSKATLAFGAAEVYFAWGHLTTRSMKRTEVEKSCFLVDSWMLKRNLCSQICVYKGFSEITWLIWSLVLCCHWVNVCEYPFLMDWIPRKSTSCQKTAWLGDTERRLNTLFYSY